MMRLRSLAFQLLLYATMVGASIVGIPLLVMPRRGALALVRGACAAALWLLARIVGVTHEVRGRGAPPPGPVIYAVKHQSAWETLAMSLLIADPAIVLKRDLTAIPVFGWYLIKLRMIAIDRKGRGTVLRRMVAAARRGVAAGRPLVMFPEGTRTAPGAPARYHAGIAALYGALGVPVVPVALNSGMFWPRRAFMMRPGRITVAFLPPIPPGLARDAFMATLEDRIETATGTLIAEAVERQGIAPPVALNDRG